MFWLNQLRVSWLFVLFALPVVASAQPKSSTNTTVVIHRYPWARPIPWAWYDPRWAISSHISAQADLLRAHGDVAVDFALARKLHAESVDMELDNWVKHVRAYWDRKLIREKKRLQLEQLRQIRKGRHLNNEKWRNSMAWNRLKNHPELTRIGQGDALNFLLHRLSNTVLACEFVRQGETQDAELLEQLRLPPDLLERLNLRQLGRSGDQLVFRAGASSGLELEWWPYLLRWEEFAGARREFEAARDAVIAEADAGGKVGVDALQRLEQAHAKLTREFFAQFNRRNLRSASFGKYSQFLAAESFLRRLDREVLRMQNTGDVGAIRVQQGYVPDRDGDDLIGLLTYMTRNGIQFAPASPGNEPAYHTVFTMMRDLYVTVADRDEAVTPRNLLAPPNQ
jgi:hypothetical protein